MDSYKYYSLLVVMALLVLCSGQEDCAEESGDSSCRFYELADKTEAASTGTVKESSRPFLEEHNDWCQDPGRRKYRTFNGTCNNPRNFGASFNPQDRVLPPAYSDGKSSPRPFGMDGLPLPSARNVSLHVHPSKDGYVNFTVLVTAWGQWVDHDLVSTPVSTKPNTTIKCCGTNGEYHLHTTDPNCYPIALAEDEYVFPGRCLEFVRSLAATDADGDQLVPRQQVNSVTSYHDGSQIYGSTNAVAESLRDPDNMYLLRTKDHNFLPEEPNSECINRNGTGDCCFLAGDLRVNQPPYLGALHTVWLREHNRIARRLRILKPKITSEEIFQMARRIVIARNQVITYNTWLPLVLGRDVHRSRLISTAGRSFYNPGLIPKIFNGFSAAAFRFGHSTIPANFAIGDRSVPLRFLFNRPAEVRYNFENVLIGMSGASAAYYKRMQTVDNFFVDDITKFLFLNNVTGKGLDLITIHIQRARDHGVPPYVKWRSFCGLRPLTGFNDVEALGPYARELARVYRSVNDIDLFTGMVHEPVDTGIVGPTVRCLLVTQFFRLKYADRFFFDNDEKYSLFSDAQLFALRKTTLAEVICQNSYLEYLPRDVFRPISRDNPMI